MPPPKKRSKRKAPSSLQGSQTHRKANLRKVDPCPIPPECKNRDPQEYENWGKHKVTLKKYGELNEIIERLTDIEICMLALTSEKLSEKYLKKFPALSSYEVTEFQLQFYGAKIKKVRFKKQRTEQPQNIISWRYTTWEYKDELDLNVAEEKAEYESYQHDEEHIDLWTGDGVKKGFKFTALPSKQKKDITDDQIKMEVFVGENEMQQGTDIMDDETDYVIDRQNCTIEFKDAPSEIGGIRARYSFPKEGPGHPKRGASLEVAREAIQEEIGFVDNGKFILSEGDIVETAVHVAVDNKPKQKGVDYELDLVKDKNNKIRWCIVFKEGKIPKASEKIKITFAKYSNRNTDVYVEIQEDDFEIVQRDALDHVEYFLEVVRNANTEKYEADFENKINLEKVKQWIKDWDVPYPSRILKERKDLEKVEFVCRCEEKGCTKEGVEFSVTQSLRAKGKLAPNCIECGKETRIIREKNAGSGKYETESKIVQLSIDKEYESTISKEIEKTCDIEPMPVFFKFDKPKPGHPDSETEDKILNLNKTPNLEDVAGLLVRQLRKIKNEAETGKTRPLIRFWGYACKKGPCIYNEKLSRRRAEWVEQKIKKILENKYDCKIVGDVIKMRDFQMVNYRIKKGYVECAKIAEPFGCGEGLAGKRKKDNPSQYDEEAHRVVIIELDMKSV
jgi:hypothetical protein